MTEASGTEAVAAITVGSRLVPQEPRRETVAVLCTPMRDGMGAPSTLAESVPVVGGIRRLRCGAYASHRAEGTTRQGPDCGTSSTPSNSPQSGTDARANQSSRLRHL